MQAVWTLVRGTVSGFPLWFLPSNLLEFLPCIPSVMGWRNQPFLFQVSFGQTAYHNKESKMMTRAIFATPKPLKICIKRILPFTHFRCLIFRTLLMWKKVETIHPVAHSFFTLPISSCKSALYFLILIIQLFPIPYKQYPVAFVTENDAFEIHPCCSLC